VVALIDHRDVSTMTSSAFIAEAVLGSKS